MRSEQAGRRFFLILMALSSLLMAAVIRPLGSALFTAAVLAAVLFPLHARLSHALRARAQLSAGILVFAVVVLIVGPLVAFSTFILREGREGVAFVVSTVRSEGVMGLVEKLPEPARKVTTELLERLPGDPAAGLTKAVERQVKAQSGNAAAAVGSAVAATGSFVFQATMMLIALFFLLLQGEEFLRWLDSVSPLRRGQTHELLTEFKRVSYAVIVSTIITAGVQASAALVGYLLASVPHPFFFAGVTFFIAFIPAIGAASVCEVAALLLLLSGRTYAALFLAAWGFLVVALVDNIIKPWLIKGDIHMPGAVVFFALIGGLGAFGTIGLLLGPLVVALFVSVLRIYDRDFAQGEASRRASDPGPRR